MHTGAPTGAHRRTNRRTPAHQPSHPVHPCAPNLCSHVGAAESCTNAGVCGRGLRGGVVHQLRPNRRHHTWTGGPWKADGYWAPPPFPFALRLSPDWPPSSGLLRRQSVPAENPARKLHRGATRAGACKPVELHDGMLQGWAVAGLRGMLHDGMFNGSRGAGGEMVDSVAQRQCCTVGPGTNAGFMRSGDQ